jgi:hypothetical protein
MAQDSYVMMRESGQRRSIHVLGCGEQLRDYPPAFRLELTKDLAPIGSVTNPPNQPTLHQSID